MAAVTAAEDGRRCKQLMMCVLVMSASLPVGTLSCPTSVCSCSARGVVVCSNKRLERIPFFGSHPDEAKRRIYEEIDLSRNDIFAVPPHAFDSVRTRLIVELIKATRGILFVYHTLFIAEVVNALNVLWI